MKDKGSKQEILAKIAQTVGALSKLKTTWKDKNIALRRLLGISYRDHVTNEEVRNTIRHAIAPYEDLITTVRKRKLRWYRLIARSTGQQNCQDDPTGHGTKREKERQTEKEMGFNKSE